MGLVKIAATKWKMMVDSLSPESLKRLKPLIPNKDKYIDGMKVGISKRIKSLKSRGINLNIERKNSKNMHLFGMDVKIPMPPSTVALDGKNYVIVTPKSHTANIINAVNQTSKKSNKDGKILHLATMQHELTEVSRMAKKHAANTPENEHITRIMKKPIMKMKPSDVEHLKVIEPKYNSHFDRKVLNTDMNMANKIPYPSVRRIIKDFRKEDL